MRTIKIGDTILTEAGKKVIVDKIEWQEKGRGPKILKDEVLMEARHWCTFNGSIPGSVVKGVQLETIDCTPTWSGLFPALLQLAKEGHKEAPAQLRTMAAIADKAKEYQNKLVAIKALIDGEYDNEQLLKIGELYVSVENNILAIMESENFK